EPLETRSLFSAGISVAAAHTPHLRHQHHLHHVHVAKAALARVQATTNLTEVEPDIGTGPAGYSPADIRKAYGFDKLSGDGAGQTIAIVDAYDDPNISQDLD